MNISPISRFSFLFFILYISLSGCVSSKITSNKSPNFNEKLTRIFLVIKSANGAKQYAYAFKTAFLQALSAKGVASDYEIVDELALESEKDLNEKISKFLPQLVMVMSQTELDRQRNSSFGSSSTVVGGTFDIKIILLASDKPIWRGNLVVYGQAGINDAADRSVKKLIEKLQEDNLL